MNQYRSTLQWIDRQRQRMCDLVRDWAAINSGTGHLAGLERMAGELERAFVSLGGEMQRLTLEPAESVDDRGRVCRTPLGPAIHIRKRSQAPLRVFLGIHMDTVYAPDHPFQDVRQAEDGTLHGPGVADAKGGLAVMLVALEALESSPLAPNIGWEVLINPDEEIGSPGSAPLLASLAAHNHLGLVFEPSLPDGHLVGARKGSGNFAVVIRGRSAHAGRDFYHGHNAIEVAAELVTKLADLNRVLGPKGVTVNVGKLEGGSAVNVVPDLAICRFNVRFKDPNDQRAIEEHLTGVLTNVRRRDGITAELHGRITNPPKLMTEGITQLLGHARTCGRLLGLDLHWRSTGGVCDGNKLAAAGLATIDTLGPRGDHIHSADEYLIIDSLPERAKLTALLLMKLASGELTWHTPTRPQDQPPPHPNRADSPPRL